MKGSSQTQSATSGKPDAQSPWRPRRCRWRKARRYDEVLRRRGLFLAAGDSKKPFRLPAKAAVDALHIAIAVVNGIDYLLTWNCTHIANAAMRIQIERVCRQSGYEPTVLCTPEELMEE